MKFSRNIFRIERTSQREYRNFGLIFCVILIGLFGLLLPWIFSGDYRSWPWIMGGFISAIALVKAEWIWYLYKPWMIFGGVMGVINTNIILSFAFLILITPLAIFFRLREKDLLNRTLDDDTETYWKTVQDRSPEHMRNIY